MLHPNQIQHGLGHIGAVDADDTILIVEDAPNDVTLLRRALQKAGVTNPIQVVGDGLEAMAYLKGRGRFVDRAAFPFPRTIITDLKMDRMNGFELLGWLHANPDCAVIPVIVLTASGLDGDVRKAYQLGANAYLVKPNRLEDLTEMMRITFSFWDLCKKPDVAEHC